MHAYLVHLHQVLPLNGLVLSPAHVRDSHAIPLIEVRCEVPILHHVLLQDIYRKDVKVRLGLFLTLEFQVNLWDSQLLRARITIVRSFLRR